MRSEHVPVLLQETLDGLDLHSGDHMVDGTFGRGGHSFAIAERTAPNGKILGIDRDPKTIARGRALVKERGLAKRLTLWSGNFSDIKQAINDTSFPQPRGIILDLGISSDQLADPAYGLSFQLDAPLDMRLDPSQEVPASNIILTWNEAELTQLFRDWGEEPQARVIAHAIVEKRRSISRQPANQERSPIITTREFAGWVETAVGHAHGRPGARRIHPATRVFQALRIAVNHELEHLERGLPAASEVLVKGGRLCVISFHSLEDRIVKNTFRRWVGAGSGSLVVKRAIRPGEAELEANHRARSAKLRVFVKF